MKSKLKGSLTPFFNLVAMLEDENPVLSQVIVREIETCKNLETEILELLEGNKNSLMHGIHDHNNGIAVSKGGVSLIKRKLKKSGNWSEDLEEIFKRILKGFQRQQDSIDYIYENNL